MREHTETAGGLLDLCRQAATARVVATGEPVGPVEPAEGLLVVQTDGVFIRYLDDWHEVKLGLVGGCAVGAPAAGVSTGRRHRLLGPSYLATRLPAQQFGPQLLAEAARRGALAVVGWEHAPGDGPVHLRVPALAVLREVVVLGTARPGSGTWPRSTSAQRTEIVDWYHASEHLWTLGKALYGTGTAETRAWVDETLETLHGQGRRRAAAAAGRGGRHRTTRPHEVLRVERGYFATNAERMDYPAFRARGLPIGSGAVESAARHLVQDRLKRAGMRWSEPGAQAVLAVCARRRRCHELSPNWRSPATASRSGRKAIFPGPHCHDTTSGCRRSRPFARRVDCRIRRMVAAQCRNLTRKTPPPSSRTGASPGRKPKCCCRTTTSSMKRVISSRQYAETLRLCGKSGLAICKNAWNDKQYWERRRYRAIRSRSWSRQGAELILSINASPWNIGKRAAAGDILALRNASACPRLCPHGGRQRSACFRRVELRADRRGEAKCGAREILRRRSRSLSKTKTGTGDDRPLTR